ncbi:MAG: thioredoxin family protein [Pseudomonadota bacterium]|nr:thioredoxin family protein [Pseudomonadota bacterium]
MQRLLGALQKRRPGQRAIPISMRGVAAALVLFIVTPQSLEATADRYPLGDISQAELLERHEVFKRNYDAYEVTAGIDGLPADLKVKILFGTWCHDSEREVPRMLKLLAASGVKEDNISLISLDIRKEEPEGRAKALDVRFTPTFIFFSDDVELGRIIERPVESLQADIAEMVGLSGYRSSLANVSQAWVGSSRILAYSESVVR